MEIFLGCIGHHTLLNAGGEIRNHVGGGDFQSLGWRKVFRVAFTVLTPITNSAGMPEHLKTPTSQGKQFHIMLSGELVDQTISSSEHLAFQSLPARCAIETSQGCLGCVVHFRQSGLVSGHELPKRFLPADQDRAQ